MASFSLPSQKDKAMSSFTLCSTHERFGHSLSLQSFHHQIGVLEQGLYGHKEPWYIHRSIYRYMSKNVILDNDGALTSASHTRTVWSLDPLTMRLPSKRMQVTPCSWPRY